MNKLSRLVEFVVNIAHFTDVCVMCIVCVCVCVCMDTRLSAAANNAQSTHECLKCSRQ